MTTTTRGGRTAIPASAFEHGDPRRYWRGCRCRTCRTSATARVRQCAYLRDTGRPHLRAPERAAQHLERLRHAGMSDLDICATAGIDGSHLRRIIRRQQRILADTEQRILAVPIPAAGTPAASHVLVPAHGTVRRLRALIADGWPTTHLGHRLNWKAPYVRCLLQGQRNVQLRTAAVVRDLHDELAGRRPEDHGIDQQSAARARNFAARKNWSNSVFWEDYGGIDDPAAPETEPVVQIGPFAEARLRAEEIRHLASYGVSPEEIARRIGRGVQYVRDVLSGHGVGRHQRKREAAA